MTRPPLPPFTRETAAQKARLAEDAWNTRDPARVLSPILSTAFGETAPNSFMGARKLRRSSRENGIAS